MYSLMVLSIVSLSQGIISLSPATTEIIFALHAQKHIIAVTTQCDFPEEARNIATVGGFLNVDFDAVIGRKPDMVLTSTLVQEKIAGKSRKSGIKTIHIDPKNLGDVFVSILEIGKALHVQGNAEILIRQMKDRIEHISNKTQKIKKRPRVYIEEYSNPPYVCGNWVPDLINIAGGEGLLSEGRSRTVSTEEIVEFNPQIIIVSWCGSGSQNDMNKIISRPGWNQIEAVQNRKIIFIDESLLNRPGPRLVQGLEMLAKIIHPELFEQDRFVFGESY